MKETRFILSCNELERLYDIEEHGIIVIDKEFTIIQINRVIENLFCVKREKITGSKCFKTFKNGLCPSQCCTIAEILKGKIHIQSDIKIENDTNCSLHHFRLNGFPLWGKSGAIQGALIFLEDVTAQRLTETLIKSYERKLKALSFELTLAEERERRLIAQDLHDQIGQPLALSTMKLSILHTLTRDRRILEQIEEIHRLTEESLAHIRSMTFRLSPPTLHKFGLFPALKWLAEEFESRFGLHCEFYSLSPERVCEDIVTIMVFKIVNELLTNIVKHAATDTARLTLECVDNTLTITVSDRGKGFDSSKVNERLSHTHGFGLFSISERVSYIGGEMTVRSEPGKGTEVTLTLPCVTKDNGGEDKE
ncbi:MAG: PAS domain-containing protein [Spirochaetales bacterium]|nr:PAS domain-containing protein [Spirochaetales bacterium]